VASSIMIAETISFEVFSNVSQGEPFAALYLSRNHRCRCESDGSVSVRPGD
jgi:hypothetical protein